MARDDGFAQYQLRLEPRIIEDMKAIAQRYNRSAAAEFRLAINLYVQRHRHVLLKQGVVSREDLVDAEEEMQHTERQIRELERVAFEDEANQPGRWQIPTGRWQSDPSSARS